MFCNNMLDSSCLVAFLKEFGCLLRNDHVDIQSYMSNDKKNTQLSITVRYDDKSMSKEPVRTTFNIHSM